MSVSPESFLAEAQAASTRADEMGVRLTIDRAYYAACHWALTVSHFCPNPTPAQAEGMHRALIRRFQSVPKQGFRGAGIAREIGAWLDKGRKPRTIADYELNATIQKMVPSKHCLTPSTFGNRSLSSPHCITSHTPLDSPTNQHHLRISHAAA